MKGPSWRHGPNSRYVRVEFRAQTLEELRTACGEHGNAAVEEARFYAATAWKMGGEDFTGGNELGRYWQYIRATLKFPRVDNRPWQSDLLHVSPADRNAIIATALRVLAEWAKAGSPFLNRGIETTQQQVHSACVAAAERQEAREAVEAIIFQGEPAWA